MTIATTSARTRESLLQHAPVLALSLAVTAVVLLALGPLGWRAGWWPLRFSLLTLMPWAAYFGIAALIVSAITLLLGRARYHDGRGCVRGRRADRLCALALRSDPAGGAADPRHYDRCGQSSGFCCSRAAAARPGRQSRGL